MSKNITDYDINMAIRDPQIMGVSWYSPLNKNMFNAYGSESFYEGDYARLSSAERDEIKPISQAVEWLSHHTAGLQLKFKTNSTRILIDVKLNDYHNMHHMPATGQCGFDLYVFDEKMQEFVHHATTTYDIKEKEYRAELSHFYQISNELIEREYILNFPLYQGVKELKIGLDTDSVTTPSYFKNDGKIVIYGTSIAQGGCVSRPGLMYSNILSRWLDMEVYNQGYSGSAMLEPLMGNILGKIPNQKLLVIDAEANAGCDKNYIMEKNLESFILEYKKHQPNTPILLVSRCLFSLDCYDKERVELKEYYKTYVNNLIDKFSLLGHKIYFLDGDTFFNGYKLNFTEFTVDGIHPTDFGNYLIAKAHYETINNIINKS